MRSDTHFSIPNYSVPIPLRSIRSVGVVKNQNWSVYWQFDIFLLDHLSGPHRATYRTQFEAETVRTILIGNLEKGWRGRILG